jgi:hypothetical protein
MTDELTFGEPVDLQGDLLPYNYFPGALRALISAPDKMNRIVLLLAGEDDAPRQSVDYHVVSQKTLNAPEDPFALPRFLEDRRIGKDIAFNRCFLGPPTNAKETPVDKPQQILFPPLELANAEAVTQVAVIIDIGIAFWNPVFRTKTGPRFKAMRYLDFDAIGRGQAALEPLSEPEIAAYCTMADQPGGQDAVGAALAARFPGSYYGRQGGAEPGTIWHGTAMADLMAGLPPDSGDRTVLMGIELPMAMLRDADGDSLGAALTVLIEGALAMTAALPATKLVIMLPWGFTGGPQDGSHPFAQSIDRLLAHHCNRDVTLILPMGNQLQDRCAAHLAPSGPAEPENAVIWRLPPDDFSDNTAEFDVAATGPVLLQTLRLTAPTGETAVVLLGQSKRVWIRRGGVIIGGIVRYKDTATGPRLRMTMAATGWRANVPRPGFAGNWVVSFHHKDDVRIWLLRDDRDWSLDKALPRRMSYLFDPSYQARDASGAYRMTDDPGSAVVRLGTASVLSTARSAMVVQADETLGAAPPQAAWYSGITTSAHPADARATVDPGRHNAGVLAAANGSGQMKRVSGTSAATALVARAVLGLPARPSN